MRASQLCQNVFWQVKKSTSFRPIFFFLDFAICVTKYKKLCVADLLVSQWPKQSSYSKINKVSVNCFSRYFLMIFISALPFTCETQAELLNINIVYCLGVHLALKLNVMLKHFSSVCWSFNMQTAFTIF